MLITTQILITLIAQNAETHVSIVAQRLITGSHVCSSATSVVRHLYVSHQEPMVTRRNVLAI